MRLSFLRFLFPLLEFILKSWLGRDKRQLDGSTTRMHPNTLFFFCADVGAMNILLSMASWSHVADATCPAYYLAICLLNSWPGHVEYMAHETKPNEKGKKTGKLALALALAHRGCLLHRRGRPLPGRWCRESPGCLPWYFFSLSCFPRGGALNSKTGAASSAMVKSYTASCTALALSNKSNKDNIFMTRNIPVFRLLLLCARSASLTGLARCCCCLACRRIALAEESQEPPI